MKNIVNFDEWEEILAAAEDSHRAVFELVKKLDDTEYKSKWDQLVDLLEMSVYVDEFEYTAKLLAQTRLENSGGVKK